MTESANPAVSITDVSLLKPGDYIEARRGDVIHLRGWIDSVAPNLGVAWVTESLPGYRRIVDAQEFSIWRIPPAA
jgi:hypothetical protein